jgi:hypothetical protein
VNVGSPNFYRLVVHLPPMSDRDNEHDEAIILDRGDDAIVADAVTPESLQITGKGVPEAAGVFVCGDAFAQIAQDQALGLDVEPTQIAGGIAIEFDTPGHRSTAFGDRPLQRFE